MIKRLQHYFRSGHIAMAPMPAIDWLGASEETVNGDKQNSPFLAGSWHKLHTFNGTAAIARVVEELSLSDKDTILLPAYCCGAELGPFRAAGCQMRFYDIRSDFSIDCERIVALFKTHPDIKLLFVTHYFGIKQPEIKSLARACSEADITLLEDCVPAFYCHDESSGIGTSGDYAVYSYRKFLPITEGALLTSRQKLKKPALTTSTATPLFARLDRYFYTLSQRQRCRWPDSSFQVHAKAIIVITLASIPAVAIKMLKRLKIHSEHYWLSPEVEGSRAVPVYPVGVSRASYTHALSINQSKVTSKRRENFRIWLEQLATIPTLQPLVSQLPYSSCPLYFPILTLYPDTMVQYLASEDIEAFNWWQHVPTELATTINISFPMSAMLKTRVVALPVHHQLDKRHIIRMADVLKQFMQKLQS